MLCMESINCLFLCDIKRAFKWDNYRLSRTRYSRYVASV